jgi:hypothetical protein
MSNLPNTLADIIRKVRRITGRPSATQISDSDIVDYINTFYIYDMPEHLRLESLRVNYQFATTANVDVYDFPIELYLTNSPPVFIAGYQSYMTQSRENFYRIYPKLNYLQQITTGNGTVGPYSGTLTQLPVMRGYKQNPPGAYAPNSPLQPPAEQPLPASQINWNVIISGLDANGNSQTLVDDGLGNLISPEDPGTTIGTGYVYRGTINYTTGAVDINATGFVLPIADGNPINAQYVPYVAARPQAILFYQDQIHLRPIPDQAYIVSIEAYQYPTSFISSQTGANPQLKEWWQLLAYGAADKIFADNGDFENLQKYRPLLQEQMNLVQRRTIVQQTSERTASIYTEQTQFPQYPFGNLFSGF